MLWAKRVAKIVKQNFSIFARFVSARTWHTLDMRQKRAQKREENMPNIKPISDLRNYSDVLHDVAVGAPVFLTKNGRGRYAILDIQDFEKTQATIRLMNELAKGRKSGEEKGWLTLDAVEKNLGIDHE